MASSPEKQKPNRHIACLQCRQRKVKCDGRQPYCKRCASGGVAWECSYSTSAPRGRRKQHLPSSRGSQPTLDGAQLDTSTPQDADPQNQLTLSAPLFEGMSFDMPAGLPTSSEAVGGPFPVDLYSLQGDIGDGITSSGLETNDSSSPSEILHQTFPLNGASPLSNSHVQHLSSRTIDMLLTAYFKFCQSVCPLFRDQGHMQTSIHEISNDRVAVRYAICALAVTANPQSSAWIMSDPGATMSPSVYGSLFYQAAAQHLLQQVNQTQTCPDVSLRLLQATILLALYELHHADFGRAWVTASHAVWITQELQLHTLDSSHVRCSVDPTNTEDARMALWATMGVTGFISLGGRAMDSMSVAEISTWLPRSPVDQLLSNAGVTAKSVFQKAVPHTLAIEEGICAAKILFPRIISHVKTVSQQEDTAGCQPYSFWTNHHKLHHLVSNIFHYTEAENKEKSVLDIVLNAMLTVLHEALIRKAFISTQLLSDTMKNAEEAALQHSLQIAKIVETSVLSEDSWARIAVPWAVYVALQSLKQRRSRRSLQYKVLQKDSTSIFEGSLDELVSPYPSAFQPLEPDFLVDALVLDSVNALQSTLSDWGNDVPLATFLSAQVNPVSGGSDVTSNDSVVGLIDFTASSPVAS